MAVFRHSGGLLEMWGSPFLQGDAMDEVRGAAVELIRFSELAVEKLLRNNRLKWSCHRKKTLNGNSTFVAAIFSNLLTATGAGARFLPPRLLQKN